MFQAERITGATFNPNRLREFLRPPFRKFEILTPTSPAHAARILEEIVEPPRKWGWPTSSKRGYFEGKIAGSRFKIHRIIHYQNSFMPIIEGNFRRDGLGTIVTLNMRLVWPIVPFWFGIILFLAWSSVAVDSRLTGPFGDRMLLLGMTLFIYLVATIPFAIEVRIAMKRLLELLRSRIQVYIAGREGKDLDSELNGSRGCLKKSGIRPHGVSVSRAANKALFESVTGTPCAV